MTDAMAAMLDELMGKTRNANKDEQGKKMDFNDPDVCQYALAGLCPYTLFSNTKSDLGACCLVCIPLLCISSQAALTAVVYCRRM